MRNSIIAILLLLTACSSADNPEPSYGCVKFGEPTGCGRGGICYPCLGYGITCPVPTKLAQGDGKLICKFEDK